MGGVQILPLSSPWPGMHTKTLTVLLKISGSHGVIVGDDALAENWARFTSGQGAEIHLFHKKPSDRFRKELPKLKGIRLLDYELWQKDIQSYDWLLVSLTDHHACETVAQAARHAHVGCAVLHYPELGSFVLPRVFDFESIRVVLPLGTADPQVSEKISRGWHRFLPPDFAQGLQLLKTIEKKVEEQILDRKYRPRIFDSLFNSHFSELLCAGRWNAAEILAHKLIQSYVGDPERRHRVSPRVGVQLAVEFYADGRPHTGKIFNLSRDGAFIATKSIFSKLTHITSISFSLPSGEIIKDAEGFVVWENQTTEPRVPIYPPGFALMFESLPEASVLAIEKYVQSQLK